VSTVWHGRAPTTGVADAHFHVLKLACETRVPRIMEISLNTIEVRDASPCLLRPDYLSGTVGWPVQKLIAYGLLRGGGDDAAGAKLADVIVKSICECVDPSEGDDLVNLQAIKVRSAAPKHTPYATQRTARSTTCTNP
jgi:hypothetical protein